jgi:cobalt-zinc-cadmium resistance protein CzcA
VPDVTNNQVQIITTSRNLSTQDVEQFITYPVELEMANIPGVKEIRSVSKFGLSVVTVVFEDDMGTFLPRQLITEKLQTAQQNIPTGFGTPFMGPITTGLGEIYQYTLEVEDQHTKINTPPMDLRTIQDWIVKRQLSGMPGVVEINTWGGQLKQYEVAVDPVRMASLDVSISELFTALESNNSVGGGGYIEKENQAYFIRGEGLVTSLQDIENIVVKSNGETPVLVKDVATVGFGSALRFGAITGNGEGEKVMGQIMLLKDASTSAVIENVKTRVAEIQKNLPEGVYINPFLERSELIGKTSFTVAENLILGAVIVIVVVILLLGNVRAGLLISSIIPLCLLFAISFMNLFGISANLMSLGAVDFGIIIDGAIIIVEFVLFSMTAGKEIFTGLNKEAIKEEKNKIVIQSASKMMRSAIFGQLIILIVFIPILVLSGVEGKMFRPMALTFSFALIGAMILCLTYVPVMAALFIRPSKNEKSLSDKLMNFLMKMYEPVIKLALKFRYVVVTVSIVWLSFAFWLFTTMGGEFIPTLDEGDLVIQPVIPTGTSLSETIDLTTKMETILIENFPEVDQVVSRIGAAEIPTDPMSMEEADVIVKLIPKSEWTSAETKDELIGKMEEKLNALTGIDYEFTQPIEMRFNELITGVRADLAIKIYGHDLDILAQKADEVKSLIKNVEGAEDISVEKTEGLPQMLVRYDRQKIAQHNLNIAELNDIVQMAFGGKKTGDVFEGERKFDLVVRMNEQDRKDITDLENLLIDLPDGKRIPLKEVAEISYTKGPAKISRDNTKRRIVIGVNVRNRDLQSVVEEIQKILDEKLKLPEGFSLEYGGQFENLNQAKERLVMAVPLALILIFILLYFTFNSVKEALLVYAAIPLAATGGIVFLWIRDLPFSISAGVGFIALFGIAVLNGIVLIEHYKEMKQHHQGGLKSLVIQGTKHRIRPVLLTASAAALGFLPMAISHSAGAEVQRPLATVVIGGLISATLLTLLVLPVIYHLTMSKNEMKKKKARHGMVLTLALLISSIGLNAQTIDENTAVNLAVKNNPAVQIQLLKTEQVNYINKASYQHEKLGVTFGYGEINAAVNDYQINVSQQFYFPTVYGAQKNVNNNRTSLAESELNLSQKLIETVVRSTYQHLVYLKAMIENLNALSSEFSRFEEVAKIRYEAGDGTLLEYSSAVSRKAEIDRRIIFEKGNFQIYLNSLITLIRQNDVMDIADSDLKILSLPDTNSVQSNPLLQYYQQLISLSESEIRLAKNVYLPDIAFGYTNQQIEGVKGLNAYSVGVRIPLFVNEKSATVHAAQLQQEIYVQESLLAEQQIRNELFQLIEVYKRNSELITYFQSTGNPLADLLYNNAKSGYEAGDLDYLEYINSMEESFNIRQEYLNTINTRNQVILKIIYLTSSTY